MRAWLLPALATGLLLSACAGPRGSPPASQDQADSQRRERSTPSVPRIRGRQIDPNCRYCVTDDPAKRQYFDQRRERYYYFDRSRKAYFWENGEPKF